VASDSTFTTPPDFAVARYNANGTPDTTFSADGWTTTDFHGSDDLAFAVAAAPGGKVVAAGRTRAGVASTDAVARYNDNGSLDATFSGDGKLTGPTSGYERRVHATVVQPDNKVLVAGSTATGTANDFFVARYNASGSLDTSFSGDGVATVDFGGRYDVALDLLIQPDGKIVVGGYSAAGATATTPEHLVRGDFALARLNSNGSLDTGFSGVGKVLSDFGGDERAVDLARQANGGIIAAGGFSGVVRYTSAGALDTSFAGDGRSEVVAHAAATQGAKVVIAGEFRVLRLNANGTADSTFTVTTFSDGYNETSGDDTDEVHFRDVVIAPDGKIVLAAMYHEDNNNLDRGAVVRLNSNG